MTTTPTPRTLPEMASHLYMAHAVWAGDIKHYREAVTAHRAAHADPWHPAFIVHDHPATGGVATPTTTTPKGSHND